MNSNANCVSRLKAHFDRMQKQLSYGVNVVSLHKRSARRERAYSDAKKSITHDFVRLFQLNKYSFGFLFTYENVDIPVVEVTVKTKYVSEKSPVKSSGVITLTEFKNRMRLLNQSLELFNQSAKKIRMSEIEFLSLFSKYLIEENTEIEVTDEQINEIKKEYKLRTKPLFAQLKQARSQYEAGIAEEENAKNNVLKTIADCAETKRINEIDALIAELTKEKKKLVEKVNELRTAKQKDLQLKSLNTQNTNKEKEILALEEAIKKEKYDFLWQYPIGIIKLIDPAIIKK